ncbi:MAG TPA: acyltransferase [Syntrophales bacterium]|nr:acyltransferase [Syntrophales bacterium]HQN78065.1 acyltransferase [Syntrophales bacterium]
MKYKAHIPNLFFLYRAIRSIIISRKVTESKRIVPIRIFSPFLKINISVAPTAQFVCNDILRISAWQSGNEPVSITLAEKSRLEIGGEFVIGNGTKISLDKGSHLFIGGKKHESVSGITENCKIMVKKKVHIGADCIISWNAYITDCDWHFISGKAVQNDVTIGDHVWIACNTSILKGSKIGNNCIVGAHSVVSMKTIPDDSIIAGNPVRILSNNIQWSRDMLFAEKFDDIAK